VGQSVRDYCNDQHAIQADIYRRFDLSFDYFGRSSSVQNHALTQHFYGLLDAAGLIEERDVQQVWSPLSDAGRASPSSPPATN
jgi:methionyl-tRNA synthetase